MEVIPLQPEIVIFSSIFVRMTFLCAASMQASPGVCNPIVFAGNILLTDRRLQYISNSTYEWPCCHRFQINTGPVWFTVDQQNGKLIIRGKDPTHLRTMALNKTVHRFFILCRGVGMLYCIYSTPCPEKHVGSLKCIKNKTCSWWNQSSESLNQYIIGHFFSTQSFPNHIPCYLRNCPKCYLQDLFSPSPLREPDF